MRSAKPFAVKIPHSEPLNKDYVWRCSTAAFQTMSARVTRLPEKSERHRSRRTGLSRVQALRGVTSALLFGPLRQGRAGAAAYAAVERYRVVDVATQQDPQGHYFDVLNRIMGVLRQKPVRLRQSEPRPGSANRG